jgi:CHAT domain-containing protein
LTENPLLRSGLALAGFNLAAVGSEDGVLTALEASTLNLLGTQLVVLSACDTGLGDIANGEGVYGLRRAFAMAGAETQLISLWQVDDFGTQSLMASYYEQLLSGLGRAEALRKVQLEMINSGVPMPIPTIGRRLSPLAIGDRPFCSIILPWFTTSRATMLLQNHSIGDLSKFLKPSSVPIIRVWPMV